MTFSRSVDVLPAQGTAASIRDPCCSSPTTANSGSPGGRPGAGSIDRRQISLTRNTVMPSELGEASTSTGGARDEDVELAERQGLIADRRNSKTLRTAVTQAPREVRDTAGAHCTGASHWMCMIRSAVTDAHCDNQPLRNGWHSANASYLQWNRCTQ